MWLSSSSRTCSSPMSGCKQHPVEVTLGVCGCGRCNIIIKYDVAEVCEVSSRVGLPMWHGTNKYQVNGKCCILLLIRYLTRLAFGFHWDGSHLGGKGKIVPWLECTYHRILFMSKGRMDRETGRWIWAATAKLLCWREKWNGRWGCLSKDNKDTLFLWCYWPLQGCDLTYTFTNQTSK